MRSLTLSLLLLLATVPGPAGAQAPRAAPSPGPASLTRAGDEAHAMLKPGEALEAYARALAGEPGRYDLLWKAAREAVNLGMLAKDGDGRKGLYARAVEYARGARAADPAGVEGAAWLAIALGREALEHGPRTRVRYAVEIREVGLEALAMDSTNAAAHHVMGEWNAEIRRLSGVERWMARKLLGGGVMGEASWEAAVEHLQHAVALEPSGLIHHLALARAYLDTDRPEEARAELREVLERPAVEPTDPLQKQAAQRLLEKLR